jgi:hypothetical protein
VSESRLKEGPFEKNVKIVNKVIGCIGVARISDPEKGVVYVHS